MLRGQLKTEFHCLPEVVPYKYSTTVTEKIFKLWKHRSLRTIAEKGKKVIAYCRKFHHGIQAFSSQNVTGNVVKDARMRCGQGFFNNSIRVWHMYDVIGNPNYPIGKTFNVYLTNRSLRNDTNEITHPPISSLKQTISTNKTTYVWLNNPLWVTKPPQRMSFLLLVQNPKKDDDSSNVNWNSDLNCANGFSRIKIHLISVSELRKRGISAQSKTRRMIIRSKTVWMDSRTLALVLLHHRLIYQSLSDKKMSSFRNLSSIWIHSNLCLRTKMATVLCTRKCRERKHSVTFLKMRWKWEKIGMGS